MSHRCSSRQGQIAVRALRDGRVWECSCGQWFITAYEGSAPAGHRGQWSGWVNWPVSRRRARRLLKRKAQRAPIAAAETCYNPPNTNGPDDRVNDQPGPDRWNGAT